MADILLVRHAQASFGADDYDKLSALGHEQARWLGGYMAAHDLGFDRVIRGGLRRHRETVEGIASSHPLPAIAEDPRLDEFHYSGLEEDYIAATGSTAATSRIDFIRRFPTIYTAWERGEFTGAGETYPAFRTRIEAALDTAVTAGGRTLIVTSGGVIGATLGRVLGLTPKATADLTLNIHNASLHRLVLEDGRLRLSLFNASPHLDPQERAHARTYI